MRRFSSLLRPLLVAALALLCGIPPAAAQPRPLPDIPEPYTLPTLRPASLQQVHDVVGRANGGTAVDGEIMQDLLQRAQCGGWSLNESADGKIPGAYGVPGREADPFGAIKSGMGLRTENGGAQGDGFWFPGVGDVQGWSTACRPGFPPYFKDAPTCMDESLGINANGPDAGDWAHPGSCQNLCTRLNNWQQAGWICYNALGVPVGSHVDGPCERGGTGPEGCITKYGADNAADPKANPGLPRDGGCGGTPVFYTWFYACTQQMVSATGYGACTEGDANGLCVQHADGLNRNCVRCEGDGSGGPVNDINGDPIARGAPGRNEVGCRVSNTQHVSFFRRYTTVGYERDAVPEVPTDVNKRSGFQVACYGMYNEFDPKTRATTPQDQICVIGAYTAATEFRNFYNTQRGRGDFGQNTAYIDPSPTAPQSLRNPGFNAARDPWYPNLGGGISFINEQAAEDRFGVSDFTHLLLSPDTARMESTVQISAQRPLAGSGSRMRATDDSVQSGSDTRAVTEWWQQQETTAQWLLTPPNVWLVLPAGWGIDLDPLNPLYTPEIPPQRDPSFEPRREPIAVQLNAREDLLGDIAKYLTESLVLPVVEEPVPVVVPLGAPTDFRAYKAGWQRWIDYQKAAGNSVPTAVDDLMERLEEYATQMDDVRMLRAELAKIAAAVTGHQASIVRTLSAWQQQNINAYNAFRNQRAALAAVAGAWQRAQDDMRAFHDVTNMPWCRNDRFTTPIYSLLDPWLPGRPDLSGYNLPRLEPELTDDAVLDFSALDRGPERLRIPVLTPVQVRYDPTRLTPPGLTATRTDDQIPALPPLPPVPSIAAAYVAELSWEKGDERTIATYLPTLSPGSAAGTIAQIRTVIAGMNAAYEAFWDAVTKPRCGTPEGDKRCQQEGKDPNDPLQTCCVLPGRETWCKRVGSDTCVHVEMDLLERLTRIGARPAVFLKEDYLSAGGPRIEDPQSDPSPQPTPSAVMGGDPCPAQDWACLRLRGQTTVTRHGWDVFAPRRAAAQPIIDALRLRMFQETVLRPGVEEEDRFPLLAPPNALTPAFHVPADLPLTP